MGARILCIGNRFAAADAFGPQVHDALQHLPRPESVELIDGGLAGLDLLRHLDDGQTAIFVDSIAGFGPPGQIMVLDGAEVARQSDRRFGHAAGIPFLLDVLPQVVDRPPARIRLVGFEGPPTPAVIDTAARLCLRLARELS